MCWDWALIQFLVVVTSFCLRINQHSIVVVTCGLDGTLGGHPCTSYVWLVVQIYKKLWDTSPDYIYTQSYKIVQSFCIFFLIIAGVHSHHTRLISPFATVSFLHFIWLLVPGLSSQYLSSLPLQPVLLSIMINKICKLEESCNFFYTYVASQPHMKFKRIQQ